MNARILYLPLLCVALTFSRATFAQDYIPIFSRDYSSRLSIEVDPVTFLLKGYSFNLRYQPMFTDRFLVGLGTYAMDVPAPILNLNPQNRGEGWDVRVRGAYFVMVEFYPKRANHGWFIGEQIGFQSFKVFNNTEVGAASFNNLLLLTQVGYSWHPFKGSFFLKPWIGVGLSEMIDGTNEVGGMAYDTGPWLPFFTVHFGYTF